MSTSGELKRSMPEQRKAKVSKSIPVNEPVNIVLPKIRVTKRINRQIELYMINEDCITVSEAMRRLIQRGLDDYKQNGRQGSSKS
jgi:hypothetical protein